MSYISINKINFILGGLGDAHSRPVAGKLR